jgi:phenylacetate-coenzyme A ligase PaaK-like adenylate-forming protein
LPSALDFSLNPQFEIPKDSSLRLLLTGGHYFSNAKRKIIEKKWNIDWYDFLGVSEIFGPIMGECKKKYGLHYDHELFLVEIIEPKTLRPIENEGIGILVITPLWGKGSPLVRYWTDDFAYRIMTPCSCGEKGDRIYVCGRKNDCIYINGKYIFPRDIEEIMFSESTCPNVYIDLDSEGNAIVYYQKLTEAGKDRFNKLFGIELKFVIKNDFENMKQHKPSFFSQKIKEKYTLLD